MGPRSFCLFVFYQHQLYAHMPASERVIAESGAIPERFGAELKEE